MTLKAPSERHHFRPFSLTLKQLRVHCKKWISTKAESSCCQSNTITNTLAGLDLVTYNEIFKICHLHITLLANATRFFSYFKNSPF